MFKNPFTPVFGGKPTFFFGRNAILSRFDAAMLDPGSEDRALFITGSRGCGKTALLEQLSQRARETGRKCIDVNSENALATIMRYLQRFDETTHTVDPQVGVNVLGSGANIKGGSISHSTHTSASDFEVLFVEACSKERHGVFVSIDEVQKIDPGEMAVICGAFQMASRKGYDVMLAIAGLPYAHNKVIHYEGCTFMRRAAHEELGLLSHAEVRDAFKDSFAGIKGLSIEESAMDELVHKSSGHPYMMQLLGYYLVVRVNESVATKKYTVSLGDVEVVVPLALASYERRALVPIVDILSPSEINYLDALAQTVDQRNVAQAGDVAKRLGKTTQQVGKIRQSLIGEGLIISVGHGKLMFNIPYLRTYIGKERMESNNVALVQEWML